MADERKWVEAHPEEFVCYTRNSRGSLRRPSFVIQVVCFSVERESDLCEVPDLVTEVEHEEGTVKDLSQIDLAGSRHVAF